MYIAPKHYVTYNYVKHTSTRTPAAGYLYYERVLVFGKKLDDFWELYLANKLENHQERRTRWDSAACGGIQQHALGVALKSAL